MKARTSRQEKARWIPALLLSSICVFMVTAMASRIPANPTTPSAKGRIFAQALIEDTLAKHPELSGLELATAAPDGHECVTIAATDAKEIGEKCDNGDLAVMRTGKPSVEKESDSYDVTLPLQIGGTRIGIIGMDFKLDQKEAGLLDRARAIAREIESRIPSKSKLFETAR